MRAAPTAVGAPGTNAAPQCTCRHANNPGRAGASTAAAAAAVPAAAGGGAAIGQQRRRCNCAAAVQTQLCKAPRRLVAHQRRAAAAAGHAGTRHHAATAYHGSSSGSGSEGGSRGGIPATAAAAAVDIAIEAGPNNSRCIWAGADVAAPAAAVYGVLTDYEALGTFIPGLAENRCLERYRDGCKLLQVGQQDLALGFKFCARCCLRITEYPAGMPRHLLTRSPNSAAGRSSGGGNTSNGGGGSSSGTGSSGGPWWPFVPPPGPGAASSSGSGYSSSGYSSTGYSSSGGISSGSGSDDEPGFSEQRFLRPRSPLGRSPSMDIAFQLVEGDFSAFKGLWRVQAAGPSACRLSYSLFVRPQPWLLVSLIEQRIAGEICCNLAAVKAHVERQAAAAAAAHGSSSSSDEAA